MGRLAGSTVAYLLWHLDGIAMVSSQLFVAADFRGLRIGRTFLTEAATAGSAEGAGSLRVPQECKLARYFEVCGFVSTEETLTRTIR